MNFNAHGNYAGRHAILSPSNYHWINYDEDKLDRVYHTNLAAQRGIELHALAHQLIRLGVRLPDDRKTLSAYVNDAIGYRMQPEQILVASPHCFGTADCLGFRKNTLRVHDLKTGATEASVHQLEVYAALFCIEYEFTPNQIDIELRIYQQDQVRVYNPDPDVIFHIIDKIKIFSRRLDYLKEVDS